MTLLSVLKLGSESVNVSMKYHKEKQWL